MPQGSPRFVHGKILHNTGSGIFYRMEVAIPERIDFVPGPVSYTHLTLPTNREV